MNPGVRGDPTGFELVGPESPNPGKSVYRKNYGNFGPSLAFAWQVPWFGEGRTTVRGGYQITYQGGGRFGTVTSAITSAPGTTSAVGQAGVLQNVYLDLTNFANFIPVPSVAPLQPLLTTGPRNQGFTTFDPNYTSPYVQNMTLSVTRSVSKDVTVDIRYIGTMSKRLYTSVNLNTPNFLYNGLIEDLNRVRTGTEITKSPWRSPELARSDFCGRQPVYGNQLHGRSELRQNRNDRPLLASIRPLLTRCGPAPRTKAPWRMPSLGKLGGGATAIATSIALANGDLVVPTGTVGAALRQNGFPDNFITTNPQFSNDDFSE